MSGKPTAEVAERALLASIFFNNDALNAIAGIVQPDDFAGAKHRSVYEHFLALQNDGCAIDENSVASRLEGQYTLADISEIIATIPNFADVESYALRVREAATLRRLKRHAAELVNSCSDPMADATALLASAETALYGLTERQVASDWITAGNVASNNVANLREALAGRGQFMNAIPTGFKSIDRLLGGFRKGNLCYLAARPSQGKTALGMQMAHGMAKAGHHVGFLSIEMTAEDLTLRLQSALADVPLAKIRSCNVRDEIEALDESASRMARLPLWIDPGWRLKPVEMRAKLRKLKKDNDLDIAFVDYVGLMKDDDEIDRKYESVTAISQALKFMAKELQIPIVALAQLRRLPAGTKPQRPELSDLRDSGSLEQDADIVIFIHRLEQHLLDKTPDDQKGKAEIIIAKNRNGPVGLARLAFIGEYCKFAELAPASYMVDVCQIGRDLAAGRDGE
jgi:replicative DNA helicase